MVSEGCGSNVLCLVSGIVDQARGASVNSVPLAIFQRQARFQFNTNVNPFVVLRTALAHLPTLPYPVHVPPSAQPCYPTFVGPVPGLVGLGHAWCPSGCAGRAPFAHAAWLPLVPPRHTQGTCSGLGRCADTRRRRPGGRYCDRHRTDSSHLIAPHDWRRGVWGRRCIPTSLGQVAQPCASPRFGQSICGAHVVQMSVEPALFITAVACSFGPWLQALRIGPLERSILPTSRWLCSVGVITSLQIAAAIPINPHAAEVTSLSDSGFLSSASSGTQNPADLQCRRPNISQLL